MFNVINNIFDIKTEEKYLEKYSSQYKKIRNITGGLLLLSFLTIFFALATYFMANKPKEVELTLVNPENKTMTVQLYDYPLFSNEQLQTYIKTTLINMFDINFVNADSKVETYQKYFSELGWELFVNEFMNEYINPIKEKSLASMLVIESDPILVRSETWLDGTQRWQYALTAYMFNKGSTKNRFRSDGLSNNVVLITLRSTEPKEAINGVVIDSLEIRPYIK